MVESLCMASSVRSYIDTPLALLDLCSCCTNEWIPAHLLCPAAVEPAVLSCPSELVWSPWIVSVLLRSLPLECTGPNGALWSPTGSPATEQGFPEIHNHRFRKTDSSLFKMNKCIQTYLKRARFTHICHEVKFQPLFHIFYISFCFLELQGHGSKHHHSVSIQNIWVRSWLPFIGFSIYRPIWTRVLSKTWNPISNIALLWTQWTAEAILIGSQELGLDITTCKTENKQHANWDGAHLSKVVNIVQSCSQMLWQYYCTASCPIQ